MKNRIFWFILFQFLLLMYSALLSGQQKSTSENKVVWKKTEGVSVPVPPGEHPRVFLMEEDISDLKHRLSHPGLKPVWDDLLELAKSNVQIRIEVDAVRYLISRDEETGRKTLSLALETLQNAVYDHSVQDITRPIGRMMVTGAIAYDWCYPLLTEEQKEAFRVQFLRLAGELECGYPPKHGWVTGHGSEWMVMRDLLSAGLALYDELPEMYDYAAVTFFSQLLPARNFWYPGHGFHQGTAYAETRFSSDLYPLWIFDRIGAGNVYHPSQQFVPYQWIYMRRPDGQLLRAGDGQGKIPKLRSLLSASYYHDGYVLADYLLNPGIDAMNKLFQLLWSDPDLNPLPIKDLPLTRYMGFPNGWMVARTGWDDRAVIAEMKVNIYNFNNHQHHDAGAFQVWYKGALAIDDGLYQGSSGGYSSPHNKNYAHRTIAHNSLLIYNPDEQFSIRGDYGNDGGQRLPNNRREANTLTTLLDPANGYKTGEVTAIGFGPDLKIPEYSYLRGDITKAYSDKVKWVNRSFVFLNLKNEQVPAALIIFDKVISADPGYQKCWLLHSMEEPQVKDNETTITLTQRGWTGVLINNTLIPDQRNAEVKVVGGPGKEYWVFGKNYENRLTRGNPVDYETGEWRIEVSPVNPSAEDIFLNVMQMTSTDNFRKEKVTLLGDEMVSGVLIADRIVLFSNKLEKLNGLFQLRIPEEGYYKILVTGLSEGTWQVRRNGKVIIPACLVSMDEGTLYFEGTGGEYTFLR